MDVITHSEKHSARTISISISPAGLGEHDNGAGAALEGSFHGADGDGLCGVTGQVGDATELLEHLPVEHGRLCLTGNLFERKQNDALHRRKACKESQFQRRQLVS